MADEEKKLTVRELFELARRGMFWRGQIIEEKADKHITAKMWLEEENITQGVFAVKSAAMHDNYVKWCIGRGITGKSILSNVELGRFLKERFKSTIVHNSAHYYVSKDLAEDEENKKKRKEAYKRKKAHKEEKES